MGGDKVSEGSSEEVGEVWAVELLESLGAKGNAETFSVLAADLARETDKEIAIKLVNVTTRVPCAMGSSLPQSQVDKKSIKLHELRVYQQLVVPLLQIAASKKLSLKYFPARNDSREDGVLDAAHKLKATRFYVPLKRNSTALAEKLALTMPGGCAVVGVVGSKSVVVLTVEKVDIFDSEDDDINSVGACRQLDDIDYHNVTSPDCYKGTGLQTSCDPAESLSERAQEQFQELMGKSWSESGMGELGGVEHMGPVGFSVLTAISDKSFASTLSGYSPITRLAILEGDEGCLTPANSINRTQSSDTEPETRSSESQLSQMLMEAPKSQANVLPCTDTLSQSSSGSCHVRENKGPKKEAADVEACQSLALQDSRGLNCSASTRFPQGSKGPKKNKKAVEAKARQKMSTRSSMDLSRSASDRCPRGTKGPKTKAAEAEDYRRSSSFPTLGSSPATSERSSGSSKSKNSTPSPALLKKRAGIKTGTLLETDAFALKGLIKLRLPFKSLTRIRIPYSGNSFTSEVTSHYDFSKCL